jgi:S1-C subfamily serine protease
MDMIGRLQENQLTISGFGTSPQWMQWVDTAFGGMKCKLEYSGIGPSDHTSFYLRDIPVLAFFTNAHADYHKPSDIAEKINYAGEVTIIQNILNTIEKSHGKASFTKTKDQSNRTGARFSVSLGIIPDYAHEGPGVKVDGVSDGKAGQKAGIKTGDIVLSLGKQPIPDIQVYMKILSGFKKGDATELEVLRGKETVRLQVQF